MKLDTMPLETIDLEDVYSPASEPIATKLLKLVPIELHEKSLATSIVRLSSIVVSLVSMCIQDAGKSSSSLDS